jgi:uncharacterized protein (DUF2225 family)
MLSFGRLKCFYCKTKVKKKLVFTTIITTAEGDLSLQLCPLCGEQLDEILKDIELVKMEREKNG